MREALGPVVEVLEAGRREGLAPGLAAAVLWGGRLVHASAHGDAQLEPGRRPLGPGCHFDVASLTKVMATGTLAAAMVDRGEISLDDPAARWLPGFEQGGKAAVALRHLLAHAGGLAAWRPYYEEVKRDPVGRLAFLPRAERPPGRLTEALARGRHLVRQAVLAEALESPPGSRTVYSDPGFMALGWALEAAGGAPLDRLCRERVFGPLALAGTFFVDELAGARGGEGPGAPPRRAFAATARSAHRGEVSCGAVDDENAWALGGVAGHAGLFSTAPDVAALGQAWLDALAGRDGPVGRETARAFVAPVAPGGRGLGWDRPTPGTSAIGSRLGRGPLGAIGHLGYTGCSLWVDLDAGLSCALLTNHVHPGGADPERLRLFRRRFHDAVAGALGIGP
ncbi:MAG TPA: serine hydrolase domain-containing protein [Anaeromyxobacteraceae bacterium]|nr:serine hydrolase domain-containing protein [Anaeromyxobacteraceae bacterium]